MGHGHGHAHGPYSHGNGVRSPGRPLWVQFRSEGIHTTQLPASVTKALLGKSAATYDPGRDGGASPHGGRGSPQAYHAVSDHHHHHHQPQPQYAPGPAYSGPRYSGDPPLRESPVPRGTDPSLGPGAYAQEQQQQQHQPYQQDLFRSSPNHNHTDNAAMGYSGSKPETRSRSGTPRMDAGGSDGRELRKRTASSSRVSSPASTCLLYTSDAADD